MGFVALYIIASPRINRWVRLAQLLNCFFDSSPWVGSDAWRFDIIIRSHFAGTGIVEQGHAEIITINLIAARSTAWCYLEVVAM